MHASFVTRLGGPEEIRYGDLPDPRPGPGQVLVATDAVGVDGVDAFVRSGTWSTPVTFPLALGRDLVGRVVEAGHGFAAGDRVWTNSAGYGGRPGATAELVAVDADRCYRLPEGADPIRFVSTLHCGATAYGVCAAAGLLPRERLTVVGANGGVGAALVQAGSGLGAEVTAVVRNAGPVEWLRGHGAADVVVAGDNDPLAVAREQLGRGHDDRHDDGWVDVLVDAGGRLDLNAATAHLRSRGRIIVIATNPALPADPWPVYTKMLTLRGFVMSGMTADELAAAAHEINASHSPGGPGPLEVPVGRVARFSDLRAVHEELERGVRGERTPDGMIGRTVLVPDAARADV